MCFRCSLCFTGFVKFSKCSKQKNGFVLLTPLKGDICVFNQFNIYLLDSYTLGTCLKTGSQYLLTSDSSPSTHTSYLSLSFSSGPFTLTFISLPLGQLTLASLVWFAYQSLRCVHDSHSWFMSNYEKDYMKALYNPFTIRILYNFLS